MNLTSARHPGCRRVLRILFQKVRALPGKSPCPVVEIEKSTTWWCSNSSYLPPVLARNREASIFTAYSQLRQHSSRPRGQRILAAEASAQSLPPHPAHCPFRSRIAQAQSADLRDYCETLIELSVTSHSHVLLCLPRQAFLFRVQARRGRSVTEHHAGVTGHYSSLSLL